MSAQPQHKEPSAMVEPAPQLVMLSCGGTGGHMTPAAALAEVLTAQGYLVEIITDARGMKYQPMFNGLPFHQVAAGTAGAGLKGKINGAINIVKGVAQAHSLVKKRKPAAVIGFGGYPSVPGVWAAQLQKIPTILHEQNAIIGKANAFLAGKASAIAISLPSVRGLNQSEIQRLHVTGNPIRADIEDLRDQDYPAFNDQSSLNIVVVGGSLGATVLSEVVPQALKSLPEAYRKRVSVIQQCRESDLKTAQDLYKDSGIDAQLVTFIDDMADVLSQAHLVIGRSGASTVAELSVAGRPAIFVPYPHHKDQQQKMNADSIADGGGAWVIVESAFSVQTVKNRIEMIFQNPASLHDMATKAKACGQPKAAHMLADLVKTTIQKG